ncbi:hypothetical protein Mapa_011448 [Marchantia paleacea]|nr:hypothetical protein Mapa_011448 [Marchantia paleacea]
MIFLYSSTRTVSRRFFARNRTWVWSSMRFFARNRTWDMEFHAVTCSSTTATSKA